jgi:hypothetical protein
MISTSVTMVSRLTLHLHANAHMGSNCTYQSTLCFATTLTGYEQESDTYTNRFPDIQEEVGDHARISSDLRYSGQA